MSGRKRCGSDSPPFQNGLLPQRELLRVLQAWIANESRGLDQILVDEKLLSDVDRGLLLQMVERHIAVHDNDPARSLASLSSVDAVIQEIDALATGTVLAEDLRSIDWNRKTFVPGSSLSQARSSTPDRDDRFRIIREHAQGGLGIVFVAEDKQLRRQVALKQIRTDRPEFGAFQSRCVQEGEITGQLEHPGIVPVYALGADTNGQPYYAMRFIRGEDLRTRIKAFHASRNETGAAFDGMPLRQLLRRFLDICNAVEYAHARGVLHRDLKPAM